MRAWPAGRRGMLEWGVKRSLLDYLARDPAFEWEVVDAEFDPAVGIRLPVEARSDDVLAASGSVVARAHHGALTLPLVGVRIERGELTIDDPVDGAPARLALVTLGAPETHDRGVDFAARLAPDADALFLFNYPPATPFDPVRVVWSPEEPTISRS